MASQLKTLSIFLASPSDVGAERRIARDVVLRVNDVVRRPLGIYIDLLGWEDTLPGYGRPQARINEDVRRCDLFIGVLAKRWGTDTGTYSSGFEEEFELAQSLREKGNAPELWLFLRELSEEDLTDAGPQLQKVLAFRQKVAAEKKLLYGAYVHEMDWERQLYDKLMRYVLAKNTPTETLDEKPIQLTTQLEFSVQPATKDSAFAQIEAALDSAKRALDSDSATFMVGEFDKSSVARLFVLANSWVTPTLGEVPTTHQLNLVYRYREGMVLTRWEQQLVFRTLLQDKHSVCPGWYWLRSWKNEELRAELNAVIMTGSADLKVNALRLAAATDLSLSTETLRELLQGDTVRPGVLEYIARCGTTDALSILDGTDEKNELATPRFHVLIRAGRYADAFLSFMQIQHIRPTEFELFRLTTADRLEDAMLLEGLKHKSIRVKNFILTELGRRGITLSAEQLLQVARDSGSQAAPAVKALADLYDRPLKMEDIPEEIRSPKHGTLLSSLSFDGEEESQVWRVFFDTHAASDLRREAQFLEPHYDIAYEILATKHFREFEDELRKDLAHDFDNRHAAYLEKFGITGLAERIREQITSLWEDAKTKYLRATLAALAIHGQASDVELARKSLRHDSRDIQREALRIIERFGNVWDVPVLVHLAQIGSGGIPVLAAEVAIRLSTDPKAVGQQLLATSDVRVFRFAVETIQRMQPESVMDVVRPHLYSENAAIRRVCIDFVINSLSASQLPEFLSQYIDEDTYYYDVVCLLDRQVYAPTEIRNELR